MHGTGRSVNNIARWVVLKVEDFTLEIFGMGRVGLNNKPSEWLNQTSRPWSAATRHHCLSHSCGTSLYLCFSKPATGPLNMTPSFTATRHWSACQILEVLAFFL